MKKTRWVIALGAVSATGLAAGGLAYGVFRAAGTPSAAPDVSSKASVRAVVARFPSAPGRAGRSLVLQRTPDGYLCVWDAPGEDEAHGSGGCNPAADPLGGRELYVSLAYDGGPSVATVTDARLSGLVSARVDRLQLVMSDGTMRNVPLVSARTRAIAGSDYRVFAYRVPPGDLQRGVTPTAAVALDRAGSEIDRQTTGIGSP